MLEGMEDYIYKYAKLMTFTEQLKGWRNVHKAVLKPESYEGRVFDTNLKDLHSRNFKETKVDFYKTTKFMMPERQTMTKEQMDAIEEAEKNKKLAESKDIALKMTSSQASKQKVKVAEKATSAEHALEITKKLADKRIDKLEKLQIALREVSNFNTDVR